jgi:hypothetical protein
VSTLTFGGLSEVDAAGTALVEELPAASATAITTSNDVPKRINLAAANIAKPLKNLLWNVIQLTRFHAGNSLWLGGFWDRKLGAEIVVKFSVPKISGKKIWRRDGF